jgi:hypothetical protein
VGQNKKSKTGQGVLRWRVRKELGRSGPKRKKKGRGELVGWAGAEGLPGGVGRGVAVSRGGRVLAAARAALAAGPVSSAGRPDFLLFFFFFSYYLFLL